MLSDIVQNFRPQNSCNIIDDGIVVRNDSIAKRRWQQQCRAAKSDAYKTDNRFVYIYLWGLQIHAQPRNTNNIAHIKYWWTRSRNRLQMNEWVDAAVAAAATAELLLLYCCQMNLFVYMWLGKRQTVPTVIYAIPSHPRSTHSKCYSFRPDSCYYWEMRTWLATTTSSYSQNKRKMKYESGADSRHP